MSTILFLMATVLWVRGHWVADTLQHVSRIVTPDGSMRDLRVWGVESSGGVLSVARMSVTGDPWRGGSIWFAPPPGWALIAQPQPVSRPAQRVGYERDRDAPLGPNTFVSRDYVGLPCWLLLIVTGILPALWVRRAALRVRARRRRRERGLCPSCGYDVRASAARCPECGGESVPSQAAPLRAG